MSISRDLGLLSVGLYTAVLLALVLPGLLRRREERRLAAEFGAADRSLGAVQLSFLLAVVFITGGLLAGTFEAADRYGLDGLSVIFLQLPALFLVPGVLGKRMAFLSRRAEADTPLGVLRRRYPGPLFAGTYSLALAACFVPILAGELSIGSRFLQEALGVGQTAGLLLLLLPLLGPLLLGGCGFLRKAALVQGLVMLAAGLLLVLLLGREGGGIEPLTRRLAILDPARVRPAGPAEAAGLLAPAGLAGPLSPAGRWLLLESTSAMALLWILAGAGSLGLPQLAAIPALARSSRALHGAVVGGLLLGGLVLLLNGLAGVWGRALAASGAGAAQFPGGFLLPAGTGSPGGAAGAAARAGLAFLAPIAAVQSSMGFLLLQLALTAGELFPPVRGKPLAARALLLLFALLAVALLLGLSPQGAVPLARQAAAAMMAVFFPLFVFGLFWERSSTAGALAGVACGAALALLAGRLTGPASLPALPAVPAVLPLAGSILVHWLVSRLTPRPKVRRPAPG